MKEAIDITFKVLGIIFFVSITSIAITYRNSDQTKDQAVVIYIENIDTNWSSSQLMEDGKTMTEYKEAFNNAIDAGEITGFQIYRGGKMYYSKQRIQ
jgi:hypothetical protein